MKIYHEDRPASAESVSWLRRAMARRLIDLRLSNDIVDDLQLILSEIGNNAISHGLPPPTFLAVNVDIVGAALRIEIIDDAGRFDAGRAMASAPKLLGVDVDEVSGRGLALVRAALDRADYRYDGHNRFIGFRNLRRRAPTALVVEDTASLLDVYTGYLSEDYRVVPCASLAEARVALRGGQIDVVIADLHLGDGLGASLPAEIEELSGDGAIPVVLLTADVSPDTKEASLREGVEFYLSKPIRGKALREAAALAISRAALRNARLVRKFARSVDGLIAEGLPSRLGPYRLESAGGTASTGGGDVILNLPRDAGHRVVLIDVMGHGLSACAWAIAYAAIVRTLHNIDTNLPTSAFLTEIARTAWTDPTLERVMATVLVVDLDERGATIASAGHPHPILFGSSIVRSQTSAPLLGVLPPEPYETQRIEIKAGDRLAIFTDGLDPAGVSAGGDPPSWFMELAGQSTGISIEELSLRLKSATESALGPQPPDDWTFVLIERAATA